VNVLPKNEIRISITSSCNMNCVYCHNEGNFTEKILDIKNIEKIIDKFLDYDLKSVRITGGEPLIHPQIFEICNMLKNKYHLRVGINTNLVAFSILLLLIQAGLVDRVVVGLDYFDKKISKNSPTGVSSDLIKKRLIELKNYPIDVTVSTVFDGDLENIEKLTDFCNKNGFRIKILEQVTAKNDEIIHADYLKMKKYITQKFNLSLATSDDFYGQDQGYKDGIRVVSFLHSLHYKKHCHYCKKLPYRISADEKLHYCLFNEGFNVYDNKNLQDFLNNEEDYDGYKVEK